MTTTTKKSEKEILNNLSAYKITWVEFRPEKGKAAKRDCVAIAGFSIASADKNGCYYRHFGNRERAMAFLQSFNKKLSKRYECRLFTDKQFGMRAIENGYAVPFTTKQSEEVIILG